MIRIPLTTGWVVAFFCRCYRLPDENTPNELFDGIPFCEVPIVHIQCTKNNTIMVLTDATSEFSD